MRTDELRGALGDLAGEPPIVDDAYAAVKRRVRRERRRVRVGAFAIAAFLIAATGLGVRIHSTSGRHVTVANPTTPAPESVGVADLTWTRVGAPFNVERVATANGRTFAVGSSWDGAARIGVLNTDGTWTSVDPAAGYAWSGSVNDLVGIPGALVAVGSSGGPQGGAHQDAWRSTDGGRTWRSVRVEVTSRNGQRITIDHVVVSNGVVYAVGTQHEIPDSSCPLIVWRSDDGTDFHLMPTNIDCDTGSDIADGPAGVVVVTSGNATVWTTNGPEWSPHLIAPDAPGVPTSNAHVFAVTGSDNGYVAVGSIGVPPNNLAGAIWWSADGITWSRVATNTPDPRYGQAQFHDVAHSAAGWIAVGWQQHAGTDAFSATSDAVVWTSPDGQHWTALTRDVGAFEQYAWISGVGATTDGFVIFGQANVTDQPVGNDLTHQRIVLWMGSSTPSSPPVGIVEGSPRVPEARSTPR